MLGFPGAESWWFENPQGKDGPWAQHVALDVTDNESPTFLDLTGDGRPEIVCMSKRLHRLRGVRSEESRREIRVAQHLPLVTAPARTASRRRLPALHPRHSASAT